MHAQYVFLEKIRYCARIYVLSTYVRIDTYVRVFSCISMYFTYGTNVRIRQYKEVLHVFVCVHTYCTYCRGLQNPCSCVAGISHMFSYSRSWALETIDSHTRSRITGSESYFTGFDAALKRDINRLTNNGFTAMLVLKERRTSTDPRTWYIQKAEPQSVPEPEDPFKADNIRVLSNVLAKMCSDWENRPDGDDYKDLVEGNARLIFGLTALYPGIRDTFSH
jgi:hypothetical protein